MRGALFLFILLFPCLAFSVTKTDSLFDQLNRELNNKKIYDQHKEETIQKLKGLLKTVSPDNLQAQFAICTKLYDEYKSYQYDSAYVYATKMLDISHRLNDKAKIDYSRIKAGFIL